MRVTMQAGKVVSPVDDAKIVSSAALSASQSHKHQQSNDTIEIQPPVLGSSMDGISLGSPNNPRRVDTVRASSLNGDVTSAATHVGASDETKAIVLDSTA